MKYQEDEKETDLKDAIAFYKDAVKCDTTYLLAYTGLALAYDYEKDYKQELNVYNKILSFSHNNLTILTEKGIVLEKLKQIDSAKKVYKFVRQQFENHLSGKPNDVNYIQGYIFLLALTEGKESALQELDKRIASYPEIASKMSYYYYFYQHFNKQAYMYNLSQEVIN